MKSKNFILIAMIFCYSALFAQTFLEVKTTEFLSENPFSFFRNALLLGAGDKTQYGAMTIGEGALGVFSAKNFLRNPV